MSASERTLKQHLVSCRIVKLDRRRRRRVVDNAIDLPRRNFWYKVPAGNTQIFGDTQIALQHTVGLVEGRKEGRKEASMPIRPARFVLSFACV